MTHLFPRNFLGPKILFFFGNPPRLGDPTVYHRTTRKTQLGLNDLCPILIHGGRLPPCLIGSTMTTHLMMKRKKTKIFFKQEHIAKGVYLMSPFANHYYSFFGKDFVHWFVN